MNGRVRLVEHDLTSGLGDAEFDLVVSNPPYVEPDELPTLQPEVRDWEPHVALVASGATEAVARAATEALRPGGWLVLETAAGAGERIRSCWTTSATSGLRSLPTWPGGTAWSRASGRADDF